MDKELQQQIAAILQQALAATQKGGQWLSGQLPDVLHQLILWTIVEGVIAVALFLIVLPVSLLWITKWSGQEDEYGMASFSKVVAIVVGASLSFVSMFFALGAGMDAIQAAVAPKLFLMEYAAHFIK